MRTLTGEKSAADPSCSPECFQQPRRCEDIFVVSVVNAQGRRRPLARLRSRCPSHHHAQHQWRRRTCERCSANMTSSVAKETPCTSSRWPPDPATSVTCRSAASPKVACALASQLTPASPCQTAGKLASARGMPSFEGFLTGSRLYGYASDAALMPYEYGACAEELCPVRPRGPQRRRWFSRDDLRNGSCQLHFSASTFARRRRRN